MPGQPLFLGIDFGTSGVRACVVNDAGETVADARRSTPPLVQPRPSWSEQDASVWADGLAHVLDDLPRSVRAAVTCIGIDGTSGSILLTDAGGRPLGPALMYNDARASDEAASIRDVAPPASGAHGATSSLAKLLWMTRHADVTDAHHALNQADWVVGHLTGRWGVSDCNNALKLGFDPVSMTWPEWLNELNLPRAWLPDVGYPGDPVAPITHETASAFALPRAAQVVLGTTDSIAAFLATGADGTGDAVTSLGSTLAIKILADHPVFAPEFGVYSHRLGERWLIGGASNTGGAVLREYFGAADLASLSTQIDPESDSGLDYYPLLRPGERFPIADPRLEPRLTPIPKDRARFLHGLLEGIARIERDAFAKLTELGAPRPVRVLSVGGGARNPQWTQMRRRLLGCPVEAPARGEAACGAAGLARRSKSAS